MAHTEIKLENSGRIALIEPQKSTDLAAVEALLDKAFGPDRHQKTAYRLRDKVAPIAGLSFVVRLSGELVGTLRFWPILIHHKPDGAKDVPALLLGPIAVEPALKGQGIGIGLMNYGLSQAKALGHRIVILVGDPDYYRRVGFSQVPPGLITMPGPFDVDRLMARELVTGALDHVQGLICPAS